MGGNDLNFNKLLLIPLVALAIGGGVGIAAATNGSAGTPANPPAADVKGPCDELEHATDPSCSDALVVPEDMHGTTTEPGDDNGQDSNDPSEVEDQGDDNGQDSNDPSEVEDQGDDDQGQQNDDQGENDQEDDSGPSVDSGSGSTHDSGDDSGQSGHDGGDEGGDD